ncbi:(Fe-S)-binding protein [Domibacillus sp. PGB-M46]|uniref:(Fe-S)-binding protein n=1 Tax=Domibacillus sp. PGB-M46 TaxID=2910255 RepID=UPI001F5870F2|nr:(Fe-S)-binding protein [Domibacillus sp. PGB-M46]MCI2256702.1 (Fe-S)-binding protein [Domibacillus sp. PGB-M46]
MTTCPPKHELRLQDPYAEKLRDLSYDAANQCVQCGYCLPACPTYESMGKESASPRGRINLVKMAAEGKIDIQKDLAKPIDLCLGCRACEVACPVDVPYAKIYEAAKEVIAEKQEEARVQEERIKKSSNFQSKLRDTILKNVFPHKGRLRLIGNVTWLYQQAGVNKLVRKTKAINQISEPMAQFEKVLPRLEFPGKRNKWGSTIPAKGEKKARVAFFAGCIMDAMMYQINRQTVELLCLVGCEVIIPNQQNCCGALHAHQGLTNQARTLAQANIEAFEQSGADYYINNAGGCGAMLCEYDKLFENDEQWYARAKDFVSKSRDITEILVQYGPLPFQKEYHGIITYQDSCHLRNVQKVSDEPRLLLQSVPGATFIEMKGSDRCCASGGIYNILHFNESMNILDEKMKHVKETKATTIVTTNPGCLLQMKLGVERQGSSSDIRSLHLVEVLAEACGIR